MGPTGPDAKPAFTRGIFDAVLVQSPKPQTVAMVPANQEFSRNAADGARENAKQRGLKFVYERTYPPATVDLRQLCAQSRRPTLTSWSSAHTRPTRSDCARGERAWV